MRIESFLDFEFELINLNLIDKFNRNLIEKIRISIQGGSE